MNKNVGAIDRVLRVVGGCLLIAFSVSGFIGVWGWIGIIPLATGLIGWCPAYGLIGIKSCKVVSDHKSDHNEQRATGG